MCWPCLLSSLHGLNADVRHDSLTRSTQALPNTHLLLFLIIHAFHLLTVWDIYIRHVAVEFQKVVLANYLKLQCFFNKDAGCSGWMIEEWA